MPDPNPNRDRRGRFARKGGGLAALALVLAVGAVGGGTTLGATGGAATGGGAAAGRSAGGGLGGGAGVPAQARSTMRVVQQLEGRGLRVEEIDVDADGDCAAHSYGQVQVFFERRPCTALYRALFEVRDGRATAVVAVAWVDMPDAAQAGEFQQLVDTHGTGNVTELTEEGARPGSGRWSGEHYTSVRDDVTVVNAQAEPVGSTAGAVRLAELASSTAVG